MISEKAGQSRTKAACLIPRYRRILHKPKTLKQAKWHRSSFRFSSSSSWPHWHLRLMDSVIWMDMALSSANRRVFTWPFCPTTERRRISRQDLHFRRLSQHLVSSQDILARSKYRISENAEDVNANYLRSMLNLDFFCRLTIRLFFSYFKRITLTKFQNHIDRGDCATCQVFIAGRATRACTGKVPPEPTLKSLQEKGLEVSP